MRYTLGYEPVRQSYTKTTRQCGVSFDWNHCMDCPHQSHCRPKIFKKLLYFCLEYLMTGMVEGDYLI